jgi:hypothetical protein
MTGHRGALSDVHAIRPIEVWSTAWWSEVLHPTVGPNNDIWARLAMLDQQIDGRLVQTLQDALAAYYGDRVREHGEIDPPHIAFLRVLEFQLDFHAEMIEDPPRPSHLRRGGLAL